MYARNRETRDQRCLNIDGRCDRQGVGRRSGEIGVRYAARGGEPTGSDDGQLVGEPGA